MKAILDNQVVELNRLTEKQVGVVAENQRTLHSGAWYFNPSQATIAPDAPPKPSPHCLWNGTEWIPDTAAKPEIISALWRAATAYVESRINAAEYARTLMFAGNERASANLAWYEGVWQDYYVRKSAIENESMLDTSMDFSAHGEKPWRFREVMEVETP